MDEKTIETALLGQNLILGEIKGIVGEIKNLQTVANGRIDKGESAIKAVELFFSTRIDASNIRILSLENAKSKQDGNIQAIKWFGGIAIFLSGIVQFIIGKYF